MGFVSDLSCPACGFRQEDVAFGLTAGCGSVLALAQDQQTGELREIEIVYREIKEQNGGPIGSDQDFVDAMAAVVARNLRPTEREISPGEAFCPQCRGRLVAEERGIM
jgi:hypothetical protein